MVAFGRRQIRAKVPASILRLATARRPHARGIRLSPAAREPLGQADLRLRAGGSAGRLRFLVRRDVSFES